ncbi:MAG: deaminase, partial [Planctomycetota bacterium]|nr:deaminase [Planctomycetota bacterium]
ADFFIDNGGTKQGMRAQIIHFMNSAYWRRIKTPSTDEVMMSHAFGLRLLSRCLGRKVGCVLVQDEHVIGSGWNGVPVGSKPCKSCYRRAAITCSKCRRSVEETTFWCSQCGKRIDAGPELAKHLDICRAVHAEERAILQAARLGGVSLGGATLFTTTFPCNLCAKMIAEVGVRRVVYAEPYPSSQSEKVLLDSRVRVDRFKGFAARQLYATHI